jgi:membrane protein DedA with SNARE-associated domain
LPSLGALHAISSSIQPWQYFAYLMAAGLGIPLSEDGLALLAGSILPSLEPSRRVQTVIALYLGVVLSDIETFLVGALLISRLAKLFGRRTGRADADGAPPPAGGTKGAKVLKLIEESGGSIGFVARFCVGMRAPIALTCGTLPGVSLRRFSIGACLGGLVTLPLQLCLGYALRERITSPVGLASLCASFYCAGPVTFAIASAVLYWVKGRGGKRARRTAQ